MRGQRTGALRQNFARYRQGAHTEAQARSLENELRKFDLIPMLNPELAIAAAKNYSRLHEHGLWMAPAVRRAVSVGRDDPGRLRSDRQGNNARAHRRERAVRVDAEFRHGR